jgi:hypothetical protein
LTVRTNLGNDLANLRLETHVQHAIGLVKNQVCDTTKVGTTGLQHIDQTTGSSNADLNAAAQVTDLRALGNTTVDASVANARGLAELGDFGLNLDGQLTGRSKDEDDGAVARSKERLGVNVDNGGKTVGQGLSGTRLGDTDDIATGEGHRPTLGLNGGGTLETLSLDLTEHILRKTSLVEGLNGAGDVAALHRHLVLLAEFVDIALRAVGDIRVLLVERLLELRQSIEI